MLQMLYNSLTNTNIKSKLITKPFKKPDNWSNMVERRHYDGLLNFLTRCVTTVTLAQRCHPADYWQIF